MPAKQYPRCLIGTLYAGENELAACEAAIESQRYTHCDHFRIDHRPEAAAHAELYQRFEAGGNDYDLFFKIDADMILDGSDALERMVDYLRPRSRVDHACFTVRDYLSGMVMMGLHVFTSRARWHQPSPTYHPDAHPTIPGLRLEVWNEPAPIATHAGDPSPYQAFHFGAHRTLKAVHGASASARRRQWDVLAHVAGHARYNPDPRLKLALLASWHVYNGDIGAQAQNVNDTRKQQLFEHYANCDAAALDRALDTPWIDHLIEGRKRKSWLQRRIKQYQRSRQARRCIDRQPR